MMSTRVEVVPGGGEGVRDAIELRGELDSFLIETVVSIYFRNCCWVVKASGLFDEGVETSITADEEGEEPWSCGVRGGLSIVRTEEEFYDVGGFPRLPPSQ
jgi:hypothetical protein